MRATCATIAASCILGLMASASFAQSPRIFYLRADAADCPAHTTLGTDCFTDMSGLGGAVWPASSATTPVTVDMGPGDWAGFTCPWGEGYVTFKGASREHSRFTGPLWLNNCESLGFQDLAVASTSDLGVVWSAATGSSTWSGVDIEAGRYPWMGTNCGGASGAPPAGLHTLYASKLASQEFGIVTNCGEVRFFGGEVGVFPGSRTVGTEGLIVARAAHRGVIQVYGAALRIAPHESESYSTSIDGIGVLVGSGFEGSGGHGRFEMSGGIVSLDLSFLPAGEDANVVGVQVVNSGSGTATARTPDTAFNLRPAGTGIPTRVDGSFGIESPFLWQAGDTPPTAPGETNVLSSQDGQDLFVETDCDSAGDCDSSGGGGGSEPHLMIYSKSCEMTFSDPWFDVVEGECRGA